MANASALSDPEAPQTRGTRTHGRLLLAGHQLFGCKGYEGTSIGDVAGMAGVGVGTVYHHFADKRALLLEVLESFEANGLAGEGSEAGVLALALQEEDDPAVAIRTAVRVAVELARRHPSVYPTAVELGRRDPEVAACCERIAAGHRERVCRAIEGGQRRGRVRPEIDPAGVSLVLQSLAQTTIPRIAEEPECEAKPAIEALSELLCKTLLVS